MLTVGRSGACLMKASVTRRYAAAVARPAVIKIPRAGRYRACDCYGRTGRSCGLTTRRLRRGDDRVEEKRHKLIAATCKPLRMGKALCSRTSTCVRAPYNTYINALAYTTRLHGSHLRHNIVPLRRTDVAQANPRFRSHDLVQDLLSLFFFLLLLTKERR